MKPQPNHTLLILVGIMLAAVLTFGISNTQVIKMDDDSIDIISNYKSTVPLIVAPLHILAKGLKLGSD